MRYIRASTGRVMDECSKETELTVHTVHSLMQSWPAYVAASVEALEIAQLQMVEEHPESSMDLAEIICRLQKLLGEAP